MESLSAPQHWGQTQPIHLTPAAYRPVSQDRHFEGMWRGPNTLSLRRRYCVSAAGGKTHSLYVALYFDLTRGVETCHLSINQSSLLSPAVRRK